MSLAWIVIYGKEAPQEEIDNAARIVDKLKDERKFARAMDDQKVSLYALHTIASFISLGGPIANKWTTWLNSRVNPHGEFNEEGNFTEFVKTTADGKIERFPGLNHGIIGVGTKVRPRLKIVTIWGQSLKDSTSVVNAYLNGEPAGVYSTPTRASYELVGCER